MRQRKAPSSTRAEDDNENKTSERSYERTNEPFANLSLYSIGLLGKERGGLGMREGATTKNGALNQLTAPYQCQSASNVCSSPLGLQLLVSSYRSSGPIDRPTVDSVWPAARPASSRRQPRQGRAKKPTSTRKRAADVLCVSYGAAQMECI